MEDKNTKTEELTVPFSAYVVVLIASSLFAYKMNAMGATGLVTGVWWAGAFIILRLVYQIILAFVSGAIEGFKEAAREANKRNDK